MWGRRQRLGALLPATNERSGGGSVRGQAVTTGGLRVAAGVDDGDGGEGGGVVALEELDEAVFAGGGFIISLDGGGGGAEEGLAAVHGGKDDGDVAGVVARRGVGLLIGRVVFLVDDDEAEAREGEEEGRAGADDYEGFGGLEDAAPEVDAFVVGEAGVIDEEPGTEDTTQAVGELGGEGDFGDQVEHMVAFGEGRGDEG